MLQIDHVYEFFNQTIFNEFCNYSLPNGVFNIISREEFNITNLHIFNEENTTTKIFFVDQEPILKYLIDPYLEIFNYPSMDKFFHLFQTDSELPYDLKFIKLPDSTLKDNKIRFKKNPKLIFKDAVAIVVSEKSNVINKIAQTQNTNVLYYFFHGFAALDWFRGYYALNYNKKVINDYKYDFITLNRLVSNDRSYRCYFVSKLIEKNLKDKGQISFGTLDEPWHSESKSPDTKLSSKSLEHINIWLPTIESNLVIDNKNTLGLASADIPRQFNDSFWHIVTETVFYYNKLHLTEKIFKPIVMKQPFMLLGAPGNLEYLKSYGFKTFNGIIDESYDKKVNPDARIEAVVDQLNWYCNLSDAEKLDIMRAVEPIVEYNFHHFYGEFKLIITTELLENCKDLFKKIGYDDSTIAYADIYKTLVN